MFESHLSMCGFCFLNLGRNIPFSQKNSVLIEEGEMGGLMLDTKCVAVYRNTHFCSY